MEAKMATKEELLTLGIVLAIVVASAVALYALYQVGSSGRIVGIGVKVYADAEATIPVTDIQWGDFLPGDVAETEVYIKNIKEVPVVLVMNTTSWNPVEAEQYLTLTWDYAGQVLAAGEVLPVVFSLQVNIAVEGITTFDFDINIYAFKFE